MKCLILYISFIIILSGCALSKKTATEKNKLKSKNDTDANLDQLRIDKEKTTAEVLTFNTDGSVYQYVKVLKDAEIKSSSQLEVNNKKSDESENSIKTTKSDSTIFYVIVFCVIIIGLLILSKLKVL